jgi:FAD/FMN-containing dehydrogenase
VLSPFGSEVVVEGDPTRDQGRFLDDLATLRKQADYGYAPIDEDVEEPVERTGSFVDRMERIVDG